MALAGGGGRASSVEGRGPCPPPPDPLDSWPLFVFVFAWRLLADGCMAAAVPHPRAGMHPTSSPLERRCAVPSPPSSSSRYSHTPHGKQPAAAPSSPMCRTWRTHPRPDLPTPPPHQIPVYRPCTALHCPCVYRPAGNYADYFGLATDADAVVYLMLANQVVHDLFPNAITVGEAGGGAGGCGRLQGRAGRGSQLRGGTAGGHRQAGGRQAGGRLRCAGCLCSGPLASLPAPPPWPAHRAYGPHGAQART